MKKKKKKKAKQYFMRIVMETLGDTMNLIHKRKKDR